MHEYRDNYKYLYISTATTTPVTGNVTTPVPGSLIRIVVTETSAGAITIYDAVAGSTTTTVGVLKASIAEGTYEFNCRIAQGIQIVTAGASKVTVIYATL